METQPPLPSIPHNSKKRVFSGASSSYIDLEMEPDVVEITPAVHRTSKQSKQKEVLPYEVIDVDEDEDEDCDEVVILDEVFDKNGKGKGIKSGYNLHSNYQSKVPQSSNNSSPSVVNTSGHGNGVGSSKSFDPGPHESVNLDVDDSEAMHDSIYYDDYFFDDVMDVEELSVLQAHFDSMDLPTGVEAPIPWFLDPAQSSKDSAEGKSSGTKSGPAPPGTSSNASSSFNSEVKLSSPWSLPQAGKSEVVTSKHMQNAHNFPTGVESHKHKPWLQFGGSGLNLAAPSGTPMVYGGFSPFDGSNPYVGGQPVWTSNPVPNSHQTLPNPPLVFPGPPHMGATGWRQMYPGAGSGSNSSESVSSILKDRDLNDILRKFEVFKKFDVVDDPSDHHYTSHGCSAVLAKKSWAKKIQEEWKILENDLPDTIFVRVYESRMDLLRAAIIGAEGTPYHDGLFFFDVFFPANYPDGPPRVYYHSGGLRLNPNLYNSGKVCLSLLNTWQGDTNEKWIPGRSTMLQVLLSIQALILNEEPYFNEPGYASMKGTASGEKASQTYSENAFNLSLKTMSYSMRRPPKHFEDLVMGHFYHRAHDILAACKFYFGGASVGSFVKGSSQVVEQEQKSAKTNFHYTLAECINMLVKDFTSIGVKDLEKYLTPVEMKSGPPQVASRRSRHKSKYLQIGGN